MAELGAPVTCSDLFGPGGQRWPDGLGMPQPYAGKVASLLQLTSECAVSDVRQRAAVLRRLVQAVGLPRLWV